MKYFFFLLFSLTTLGQIKPLQFELDEIVSSDSTATITLFHLRFHIINPNEKPVSFIVNTEDPIPFGVGSGSHKMYYTLFENEVAVDRNDIFFKPIPHIKTITYYDTDVVEDVLKASIAESVAKAKEELRQDIMTHIIRLQPNERKDFESKIYWDKIRYRKDKETEYYIDEETKYFIQLDVRLMLEELKDKLSEEEYQSLIQDQTIIKGWYTSNKKEINFN